MDSLVRARPGALLLIGVLASGLAWATPQPPSPQTRIEVNEVLANAPNREIIDQVVGIAADKCMPASPRSELCLWKLGDRETGWAPLAKAIGTRKRVALVCELPRDGSPRAADACSATPQNTNKRSFLVKSGSKGGAMSRGSQTRAERRQENQAIATAWIEEARTLVALTRLLGALPDSCEPIDGNSQSCLWRTNNHVYGHGTVVTWAGLPQRKQVRFTCLLPLDGGGRGIGSCQAMVGS